MHPIGNKGGRRERGPLESPPMANPLATRRVLFICLGNICRSPTGEGVLRALVAERGLDGRVEIDSAGTLDYHAGQPADPRMRAAAGERGYELDSRARQVTADDFRRFDLVVAMDRSNRQDLLAIAPAGSEGRVRLLSEFLPAGSPADVPDPYWSGAQGFERVIDMIEEACPAILDELLDEVLTADGSPGPPGGAGGAG